LENSGLTPEGLSEIFHAQILSRHLDLAARKLSKAGQGFYTIGSSGHEGNAAVAWAFNIPPQTSTIASHLPKAVGAAFSVGLAKRIKPEYQQLPNDAVILCSFGDASLNHSTAQGAINTASWSAYQNSAVPMVFLCEDNGIGISTKTPRGWVEASISSRPGLEYIKCNGLDAVESYAAAHEAQRIARARKKPVFLNMSCIRLYGHAGPDVQTAYLDTNEVEAQEANDPLLHTARRLIENNFLVKATAAP